jgi:hypothetical protein
MESIEEEMQMLENEFSNTMNQVNEEQQEMEELVKGEKMKTTGGSKDNTNENMIEAYNDNDELFSTY